MSTDPEENLKRLTSLAVSGPMTIISESGVSPGKNQRDPCPQNENTSNAQKLSQMSTDDKTEDPVRHCRKKSTRANSRAFKAAAKGSRASGSSNDAKVNKIQMQIKSACNVLDPDGVGSVDNRLFKTLVYALHRVPNKNQLDDMFETIQDDKNADHFSLDKFESMMFRVMSTDRYRSSTAKELMAAFHVLDTDKKGFFTSDEWATLLTSSGEPFTREEITETLKLTVDPDTDNFVPANYVQNLVVTKYTH